MVSPLGDFFFYFFNALLIYLFSYDIHLDHLNNDDDSHNDYIPSSTPTPPTLQRSPTTQTAMATAAGARDATRLELLVCFYFSVLMFF